MTHIEITVGALVEIIYAFASTDLSVVPLATKLIMRLLISEVCCRDYILLPLINFKSFMRIQLTFIFKKINEYDCNITDIIYPVHVT